MNILTAAFCVLLFSLTVPLTRLAALETSPQSIIFIRIIGAGIICGFIALKDGWLPPRRIWKGIAANALFAIVGFSSLTAFAMKYVPSSHAAVGLAAMPMATAAYAVLRDRSKPGMMFWIFAILGTLLSFGFFFTMNVSKVMTGDILLVLAVISVSFGYVEGGRMSREFGGRRIMSWLILVTLPIIIPLAIYYFSATGTTLNSLSTGAYVSLAYLALVSQSTGMFLWLKVLGKGPMEKIALIQLLQPFLTLLASILLLNESVPAMTWLIACLVAACIVGANRERWSA